jgi:dUTP pyrophosphatase
MKARKLVLKVKRLVKEARLPERIREGDAGLDIRVIESGTIKPGEIKVFRTGIALEIPKGYFGLVASRSGLSTIGIVPLGMVIDENYRGEIKIVLINLGSSPFRVKKGMRVAQIVIVPYLKNLKIIEVEELGESERGDNGFGSSGLD